MKRTFKDAFFTFLLADVFARLLQIPLFFFMVFSGMLDENVSLNHLSSVGDLIVLVIFYAVYFLPFLLFTYLWAQRRRREEDKRRYLESMAGRQYSKNEDRKEILRAVRPDLILHGCATLVGLALSLANFSLYQNTLALNMPFAFVDEFCKFGIVGGVVGVLLANGLYALFWLVTLSRQHKTWCENRLHL